MTHTKTQLSHIKRRTPRAHQPVIRHRHETKPNPTRPTPHPTRSPARDEQARDSRAHNGDGTVAGERVFGQLFCEV